MNYVLEEKTIGRLTQHRSTLYTLEMGCVCLPLYEYMIGGGERAVVAANGTLE